MQVGRGGKVWCVDRDVQHDIVKVPSINVQSWWGQRTQPHPVKGCLTSDFMPNLPI